jgi:protein-tyrosine phosphatase
MECYVLLLLVLFQVSDTSQCTNSWHIIDNIYLGNQSALGCLQALQIQFNVSKVLIAAPESEVPFDVNNSTRGYVLPLEVFRLSIRDDGVDKLSDFSGNSTRFLSRARSESKNVIVLCKLGKSRSSSLLLSYFMTEYRFTLKRALYLLKSKRSSVQPRYQFFQELMEQELRLFGSNTVTHSDNYIPILLGPS